MIINYDPTYPPLIADPNTGVIDWLAMRNQARQIGDWFASGSSVLDCDAKRLTNMWFFYCWLKYSGYAPFAARAIASCVWFECGFDGSEWGTGRVRSPYQFPGSTPVYDQSTPPVILYYEGFTKIYPSNWQTLPGSWPISWTVPNVTDPTIVTYPSYGLVQWTPYGILWEHSDLAGQDVDEDWTRSWLNNSSLQCFILDWEQEQADNTPTTQQTGTNYKGEWINDRHTGELDIITCTWQEWKDDSILTNFSGSDDDKFLYSCHQFLVHYIHATPQAAQQADQNRLTVLHTYIDNAFSVWDNSGGGWILDMPPPPDTWADPWHMNFIPLLQGRKKKNVLTILL